MTSPIRIATRKSQLAIIQAEMIRSALLSADTSLSPEDVVLLPMSTQGDQNLDKDIKQWGYKGLFTKEIEEALLDGRADIAMHSMKDMPSILPNGLMIGGMLPRDDARDAFISKKYTSLDALPQSATLGTSSVRRAAMVKYIRPDMNIVPFRGNVNTRLRKLEEGGVDATLLAVAGLERMEFTQHITDKLSIDTFLPAVAQGAIGMQCREVDADIRERLATISCADTVTCVNAERAMLAVLDGSCKTPIGGHSTLDGDILSLTACVVAPDGSGKEEMTHSADKDDAEVLGKQVGEQLKVTCPKAWLDEA